MNTSKSLVISGQQVAISLGAAVNAKGGLIGARHFVAAKAGITLPKVAKGEKGPSMKEVKAMVIASGKTDAEIKAWFVEYDIARAEFYRQSGQLTAMLAQDPTYRKSVRISTNPKGEVIGATTTFRRERSAAKSDVVAALQAQVAALQLALGAKQLPSA